MSSVFEILGPSQKTSYSGLFQVTNGTTLLFDCECIGLTLSHTQNTTAEAELLNPPIPDSLSATQIQAASVIDGGIKDGSLPAAQFTASSSYDNTHAAHQAREDHAGISWAAGSLDENQSLTVQFLEPLSVSKIMTQGRENHTQWVTKYDVAGFLDDAEVWRKMDLVGNTDRNSKVFHDVPNQRINKITFYPQQWISYMSMRVGVRAVQQQIVEVVSSGSITEATTHRVTINEANYDHIVTNTDTVQTVLSSLRTLIADNTSINAQLEDNKLVLSADNTFNYSAGVIEKARKKVATNNETSALINFADDPVTFKAGGVVTFNNQGTNNESIATAWFKSVN